MKKTLLLMGLVALTIVFMAFDIQSDNGIAGYTGSPGQTTCTNCHNSFGASNSGPGSITIRSTMNNWQYVPGQTYTISVVVSQAGRSLFGVGCEVLTATNTNAGSIIITNPVATRTRNTQSGRINVVHQNNGGASADSAVFSFDWTAPSTNIGNVTFYFAGIAANNNGQNSGDYVYNSSQVATPATSTGLVQSASTKPAVKTYVNQTGNIAVTFEASSAVRPVVEIYDLKGSLIARNSFDQVKAGSVVLEMERPASATQGTFIVRVTAGDSVMSDKINLK